MGTRPRKYIWVNRSYFSMGLKALDILILSKIEEDNMHGRVFDMTNEEMADMFSDTIYGIKKSLSRLEKKDMVIKRLYYTSGHGKSNRRRELFINNDIGKRLYDEHKMN